MRLPVPVRSRFTSTASELVDHQLGAAVVKDQVAWRVVDPVVDIVVVLGRQTLLRRGVLLLRRGGCDGCAAAPDDDRGSASSPARWRRRRGVLLPL